MKLASISYQGSNRLAAQVGDSTLIDLAKAIEGQTGRRPDDWPQDMIALIEGGPAMLEAVRAAVKWAEANPSAARIPMDQVKWQPPVRRPSKLCCLALNNSANADRIMSGPKHPAIFIKAANALIGHNEPIEVKEKFGRVHPEPEMAVVIGKFAKNVRAENAYDHVFGYTIHNDITAPNMRGEDTFHYRAIHPSKKGGNEIEYLDSYVSYPGRYKGSDTFSPLGPVITTKDEIADPHNLTVTCSHLGELVTEDNTMNLFHKVPQVIQFITEYITLLPGDIVSMGTALKRTGGTGKAVQNCDLYKLGGPVTVTIEKIGTLSSGVARV
jgi:2-keto-4-pentenoate hydratase/2-oxohepta-3-ene-1,7-dioic acid hydratase in catechol pathway